MKTIISLLLTIFFSLSCFAQEDVFSHSATSLKVAQKIENEVLEYICLSMNAGEGKFVLQILVNHGLKLEEVFDEIVCDKDNEPTLFFFIIDDSTRLGPSVLIILEYFENLKKENGLDIAQYFNFVLIDEDDPEDEGFTVLDYTLEELEAAPTDSETYTVLSSFITRIQKNGALKAAELPKNIKK